MRPGRYLANFDSATGFMRAISRSLHGKDFPSAGAIRWVNPHRLVRLVNMLPMRVRDRLYAIAGATESISPRKLDRVDAEQMARWVVSHYPRRRFPAVAIGSSGGALVHLCAALQIPWLPQTLLLPVFDTTHPDEPRRALRRGLEVAGRLLDNNPLLQLHHMHDASQDRLMLNGMSYFRVKRRELGPAFTRYLEEVLPPGGTLLVTECRRRWPVTRLAPRHVFQHGALGGTEPWEFIDGSERVEAYLRKYHSHRVRWDSPRPDEEAPEAEWGFEPALLEDILLLARRRGYRVLRMVHEEPEHLSPLVADLYRWWYARRRIPANRLVVESFVELEPYWTLRTGSVPFWMKFNMEPSADWLESYLEQSPPYDFIHLMLMAHGVENPGLAPIERWEALLERARIKGQWLGVDPRKYPRDFAALARYHAEFRKIPARYPLPGPLPLGELERFLASEGSRYPVQWLEGGDGEPVLGPPRLPRVLPEEPRMELH